jgi:hypothetical protein
MKIKEIFQMIFFKKILWYYFKRGDANVSDPSISVEKTKWLKSIIQFKVTFKVMTISYRVLDDDSFLILL